MKWRDILLTLAVLLCVAPFIQAQTQPVGSGGGGGLGRFIDGSATVPSIAFINETNTGFYRNQANQPRLTINGSDRYIFDTGVLSILSNTGGVTFGSSQDLQWLRSAAATMTLNNSGGPASLNLIGTTRGVPALPAGSIGIATVSTTSVGNVGQGARLALVCGPTAGTGSLLLYVGTTNVPVVLANAVGGGLIGC